MKEEKVICHSKDELKKLFGETCEMLQIDFDKVYSESYIYLSEIYNNKEVQFKMIHEIYHRVNLKYKALKPLQEFLEYEQ